jgi:hypothetical protein
MGGEDSLNVFFGCGEDFIKWGGAFVGFFHHHAPLPREGGKGAMKFLAQIPRDVEG